MKAVALATATLCTALLCGFFFVSRWALETAGESLDDASLASLQTPIASGSLYWALALQANVSAWFMAFGTGISIWLGVVAWTLPPGWSWTVPFLLLPFLSNSVRSFVTLTLNMLTSSAFVETVSTLVATLVHIPVVVSWVMQLRGAAFKFVRKPVAFAVRYNLALIVLGVVLMYGVAPLFDTGDTASRVLLRIFVWPLSLEFVLAIMRFLLRMHFADTLPFRVLPWMLLPIMSLGAALGRLFVTATESITITIIVSVIISSVEVTMRISMPQRDAAYEALWRALPCTRNRQQPPLPEQRKAARRMNSSFYSFLLLDTMCEDVAILVMIPLVALWRIPSSQGGPPLGLPTIIARVAIQLLLEFGTDVFPYVLYWLLHTVWGERTGYVPVPASLVHAGALEDGVPSKASPKAGASLSTLAPALVDDSDAGPATTPLAAGNPLAEDSGSPTHRSSPSTPQASASPMASATADRAPGACSWAGFDRDPARTCTLCNACCPPNAGPAAEQYVATVRSAHAVQLADEDCHIWEPVQPQAVHAAMAQCLPQGTTPSLGWQFTLLFQAEQLATRLLHAFAFLPSWWALHFITVGAVMVTFAITDRFAPARYCPFDDGSGGWYYDACGVREQA